jgi:hypothetical protein
MCIGEKHNAHLRIDYSQARPSERNVNNIVQTIEEEI